MKTKFQFFLALSTGAVGMHAPTTTIATLDPQFEIIQTIPFEAPFDTTASRGFHLALDSKGGESFLAVPGELYRFHESLTESTTFEAISPGAARVGKVSLFQGRLFFLYGELAEPDEEGKRILHLFSDNGGQSWESIEDQFLVEEELGNGEVLQFRLPVTWMQYRNGVLYCDAGGFENVFISADNGETWEVMNGPGTTGPQTMGARLITDEYLFIGGEAPLDRAWIRRWPVSEDGRTVTGEREQVQFVGNANVMSLAEDTRTRSIFAGAEGRILRSQNRGDTFEYVLLPHQPPLEPGPYGSYPYIEYLWVCPDYAGRILAGGFDKADLDVVLLYSDADGAPESWINLSHGLTAHGEALSFIEQDADGRILVGASQIDAEHGLGQTGTLTIAELKLPDPIRDGYPGVERLGKGWWREAALGTFNAQWYPWQWHADWRGWMWNAEISAEGGHVLWDAEMGWLWMGEHLFPLVWHYESGGLLRLDTSRPGRVFQRFEEGEWVDVSQE